MRGVPVSLILGSFLVLTTGVADAHRSGRGHGYEGCRGQDVERHHHRRHVEGRGHGPVSERHGPETHKSTTCISAGHNPGELLAASQ